MIAATLGRARALVAAGDDGAAKQAYLAVLLMQPTHCCALTELGALAHASGFVSAARDAYRQAVRCHPGNKVAHVGYAYLLNEAGDLAAARLHYEAALAIDAELSEAHQGLARVLTELGENGDPHWRKGFAGHAIVRRRYRGAGSGIPLVMLVSARGGNIPVQHWIDDKVYAVTAIYADFFDPGEALPAHAMIVNAIGDADLCGAALVCAERIVARCEVRVINAPSSVRVTGRADNARRLGGLAGVRAPRMAAFPDVAGLGFPLLLRAPGYHTGQHFRLIKTADDLMGVAASLPGAHPLAIEYLDARGPDGMARKYRVMFIGGVAYPLHLAISADWMVHYFTAAMAADPIFREEERRFLDDMPGVLGPRAMMALAGIQTALGLDYAGIDFALARDGSLLLFEANATMAIIPLSPKPIWDYRRRAVGDALDAARRLLPGGGG